ncbi:hypothetical protein QTP70_003090, partial [Hemibagrus guttatus]
EDSFELHSVDLELEAVEKQIRDLQVKQAQLRQRKAAFELSRTDAHLSQAQRKDAARPGFVHSGAGVPHSLDAAAAEDMSQAPGEDLSPSAATRLRDPDPEPLRSPSRDGVRRGTRDPGEEHRSCGPPFWHKRHQAEADGDPEEGLQEPGGEAMLQTISPDLLPFITTVINGSLTSGHVPTVFKKARVIPILKKPALDPSDISNYRPNNLHDPNQSGFKAAHSTETALLAVTEKLHAAAFDTVNHKTLLSTLRSLVICGTAWEWFASYLDGRSYQVTWKGLTSVPHRLSTGVPQGSVLGPLLFSLYTHSLGKVISSHGFSYHCYADDTQLIFSFPPSGTTASARISACLVDISSWMTAHQLKLNPSKTELLIIPGDPSPAQDLAISLNNSMISPSATARNLGVTMDNQLSFSSHVTNVTRSCRFLLYNIRRIRPFLSTQATQVLVQSLVISRLDYCNSLLAGLPLNAIRPLQMIQNAAARLVFNLPKFSHTTPLLRSLHWLPVAARIRFKTLMLAYKAKNGPAPSYLKAVVTPRTAPCSLRSTSTARLVPPSLREKGRYTSRLFSVLAPRWWNELHLGIHTAESLTVFKRQLKTYLFLKHLH